MIIFKRLVPPEDHLQETRSSGWSFARGWILRIIICKRPDLPDDHLQKAGSSGWLFARGRILGMIICKRPDPPDDHLQEAESSRWSFAPMTTTTKMCFFLISFLWLSFCKADWPDLPSLYCLQYSPVSAPPGQQNTKLPAWQSEKHEILDKNYAQPSSQERFQYLHKGCCQQWLMKKTVNRRVSCMPIDCNTCSIEHWTQK